MRNVFRSCQLVALLFNIASSGAEAPKSEALLAPGATVVLLTGLAGDVESENSYSEQVRTWVELVQGSGNGGKIFILSDNGEPVGSATVLKADRTNFLSLGPMVAGKTNPLLVVAWGHGGKQGNTPVFHVKGPRLTPSDFKALADQGGRRQSKWILLFRGSGAFASALATEHREIISSESDTIFASDPIGMPVLLKLARAKPDLPFRALAEQFGRATVDWYKERNLARTEEPTLWVGNAKPILLAGSAEDATSSPKAEEPTALDKKEAEAPDLPVAWKEIKRVDPKNYPETDGVVLRRRLSYTIGSNPAIAADHEEFIQILAPEGKRFGDFDVSFSPPFEDISFLDCEVLRPDGKLARLDPDAIREAREEAVGDYQAGRRKFFSLPGVVPGAVLHVRYQTQWKNFPLPHVSLEIPIGQDLPGVESVLQISVPKDAPFHFAFEDVPSGKGLSADPLIKQTSYGTTYSWRFENLTAQGSEVLSRPRQRWRLLLSTFPDWPAFGDWYTRISKLADEITPEITAKATELTKESKSNREKVLALYNYVTGLRYVAIPLGVNSFRPHAAAKVLQNQYGDCKDKANLFNTLLRSLQMEAQLVLVPRFTQAHDLIPGLSFNHAISRVKLGSDTIWVDTTDDVCRFGMLPPGDAGRRVLVIGPEPGGLTQLPLPEAKDHQLKLHGEIDCSSSMAALPATLSAIALGYPDYELRETARETKEHRASLPLLAARFRQAAGSFALDKQSASSIAALDENFTWRAEGTCIGICARANQPPNNAASFSLQAPFWLPKEWDLALHRRNSALFVNQGYPLTLEEEFEIKIPPKAQQVALPTLAENKGEPLSWRIQWAKNGEDRLVATFRAELIRGELSLDETKAFQKQLRELLAATAAGASFELRR